ncbi:MAG: biotin-dependent carboxyltransferase family protein [Casimicrobiaceae bacterium]
MSAAARDAQPGVLVERPGMLTTVQDLGRFGWQHLGIVPSGAMDGSALRLANALVGNPPTAAALEITLRGPSLHFESEALVALAGADFGGKVIARGQTATLPLQRPVLFVAGSHLIIEQATRGARGYLAVAGGFALAPILGSRATYMPAGFGGFAGRALKAGDRLPLDPAAGTLAASRFAQLAERRDHVVVQGVCSTVRWWVPAQNLPDLPNGPDAAVTTVRCTDGHHRALFTAAAHAIFESTVFRIAPDSNRMGYRMRGATLARKIDRDVLSEPTCLGTVQVPADGLPIVLMADHQTTGGYAKIAEVALADIPRLAQLVPGAQVRFSRCTLDEAVAAQHAAHGALVALEQSIGWQFGDESFVSTHRK